jgi:thiol-disulfide isomerase/thioredoxin
MLVGFINRGMIFQDTAFHEFAENNWYTPQPADINALKSAADSVHFIVIFGTWCHDSQNLIPQFYKWIDAADFPERKITLIAVDKQKKAQGSLAQAFGIKSTPTFIVMRNGQELGRVVEYGKGNMVAELAELIRK